MNIIFFINDLHKAPGSPGGFCYAAFLCFSPFVCARTQFRQAGHGVVLNGLVNETLAVSVYRADE